MAITRDAPHDCTGTDGTMSLSIPDWRARTAYGVTIHRDDVVGYCGSQFSLSDELSNVIMESKALWMLDRTEVQGASGGWRGLMEGSDR